MTILDTIILFGLFIFLLVCFLISLIAYIKAHNKAIELENELIYYKELFTKMKDENEALKNRNKYKVIIKK